jgi:type II secretion system protein N
MRVLPRLLSIAGYLLFTLMALALMLWYQFPGDAVKKRLEAELSALTPGVTWKIDKVSLAFPAAVKLTHVTLYSSKRPKESGIRFDSLSLRPNTIQFAKKKKISVDYTVELFQGSVKGHLDFGRNKKLLSYNGIAKGIKLVELLELHKALGRKISGVLSANFSGSASVDASTNYTSQGNVVLTEGVLGLQQPVLGMKKIDFNTVNLALTYNDKVLTVTEGRLAAKMLTANFTGTVTPYKPEILRSSVQVQGDLTPRPELMASLGSGTSVNLLKKQLKNGKLSFTINGSLTEPGIVFAGLPANLNSLLQGSR